jgi:hypothetical protein
MYDGWMAVVIAVVISWDSTSWSLKALESEYGCDSRDSRRTTVVAAVAGLTQPPQIRT